MSVKERQLREEVFERGDEIDKLLAEIERLRALLKNVVGDVDEYIRIYAIDQARFELGIDVEPQDAE